MAGSLTAADIQLFLAIPDVFGPVPQQIHDFAADDIIDFPSIRRKETSMGVDGALGVGFIFVEVPQGITLQPFSPSNAVFDAWAATEDAPRANFFAQGVIVIPGIATEWTLVNGSLVDFPPIPSAGKVLKPRKFGLVWERVSPAVVL